MKRALALSVSLILGAAACGPAPRAKLPDLPPPEYETPRGYDLDGAAKQAPSATPSAVTPATAAPSAPPPPAPAAPKS